MKTTRYQFETTVQSATEKTVEWLKEEFRSILESDRDYTRKADYIGFSVLSIDQRIQSIDEEIKELQQLKKQLKTAKEIVLQTGAEIFLEYGIDKIDGAGISSITYTGATTSDKSRLVIDNTEPLIEAGLYKKVVDEELVKQFYTSDQYAQVIQANAHIEVISTPKPAKIRINKRRGSGNNTDYSITEEVA
ncbi:hypothetical protein [Sulfurovum riftiae]|uniref:Uncharacterized protein n=1 Tax=Sulfurovum riftiae TaxID=1630136 RepID=A0A151CJD0_9BACT|nr:hypothetical protein [Sulfurovum riftiae]KYJ87534.1 hypothetical protein AS592_10530 [Sulfurovum riftiae]